MNESNTYHEGNQAHFTDQPESNLFNDIQTVKYGSFWERFAAALIDGILIGIVGYLINRITGNETTTSFSTYNSEGFSSSNYVTSCYSSAGSWINIILGWLYYAFMESGVKQATLGKMALGLKVTGLNGQRISFLNATGRHFAKWLSTIILLIGYLMMLWDAKKQTLHDKLAGTLVVKNIP